MTFPDPDKFQLRLLLLLHPTAPTTCPPRPCPRPHPLLRPHPCLHSCPPSFSSTPSEWDAGDVPSKLLKDDRPLFKVLCHDKCVQYFVEDF